MEKYTFLLFLSVFFLGNIVEHISADEKGVPLEHSWDVIKMYQYGNDLQVLINIELGIRTSNVSSETQSDLAAKLAAYLNDETTLAGRQFVCLQLRFIGTSAQVPVLAKFLNLPEDSDNARMALQAIAGEESLAALREALKTLSGRNITGVIESLAARKDLKSVPELIKLINSEDRTVAIAAVKALGAFESGIEALLKTNNPDLEQARLRALLRIANQLCTDGKKEKAGEIFDKLSSPEIPKAFRRTALAGQLKILSEANRKETVYRWFSEDDAEKNRVAASHLNELSAAQLDELTGKLDRLPAQSKIVFLKIAAERQSEQTMEMLRKVLEHGSEAERLAALRVVGSTGDVEAIPLLITLLKENNAVLLTAITDVFHQFPKEDVCKAFLPVLDQPALRQQALDILSATRCYAAIDPLIPLAKSEDATLFVPVIAALGKICDPDRSDIPRMLKLYLASRPGVHQEQVERAIVVICEKDPNPDTRANLLLEFLKKEKGGLSSDLLVRSLPLLGRVGNREIAAIVLPLLKSERTDLQRSAIRALCNWPNADYHDTLWSIVKEYSNSEYSRWALRAYIRVVTLKSDRPDTETFAMLKKAMQAANDTADKQWCLSRCIVIRTMESVEWAASYLDDTALAQTACEALAELARHRFLREPNKERFIPILDKVEKTAKDPKIIDSVQKSRLGM
ncbi:MAG: hypothetical protein FWE67_06420 [Planctomycetaceae bacterium]|nr:hypothetical protein [Planctomycetaceae bacterium]